MIKGRGHTRHVPGPSETGDGWAVWRHDRVVEDGFDTRDAARSRCSRLNAREARDRAREGEVAP